MNNDIETLNEAKNAINKFVEMVAEMLRAKDEIKDKNYKD